MQPKGKRSNRSTRADVAREAGVSEATVSYVLNGTKCISPEVRERVLLASRVLNYTPNRIAQSLAGSRTNSVAVVTEDIGNLYHLEVIKGMQAEALNRDFIVYIFDASDGVSQYVNHIVSRGVDGVFVIASETSVSDGFLEEIRDAGIRVLADYARNTRVAGVSYIQSDLADGYRQIAAHLYGLGHRAVGYVGEAGDAAGRESFLRAAAEIWKRADLPVFIGDADQAAANELGEQLADTLLKRHPKITAVVCANDAIASGVADAARVHGLRIPEDLSVVGAEILKGASAFSGLTTLNRSGRDYGGSVFGALYEDIEKERSGEYVIPVRLIVRRSTAPPRKTAAVPSGVKEGSLFPFAKQTEPALIETLSCAARANLK